MLSSFGLFSLNNFCCVHHVIPNCISKSLLLQRNFVAIATTHCMWINYSKAKACSKVLYKYGRLDSITHAMNNRTMWNNTINKYNILISRYICSKCIFETYHHFFLWCYSFTVINMIITSILILNVWNMVELKGSIMQHHHITTLLPMQNYLLYTVITESWCQMIAW